jgi:outer membrane murein-binding lipoprotein Lpp
LQTDLAAKEAEADSLTSQLSDSEAEVTILQGNVSTLNAQVTKLTTDLDSTKSQLDSTKSLLATTQSQLSSTQSNLSSVQAANTTLTAELRKIKDARHFGSLPELTDWLQKDDTDTKYASLFDGTNRNYLLMAFILQERAVRDGYLLPAYYLPTSNSSWISNYAIIGDMMYLVEPGDDSVTAFWRLGSAQPGKPEPLP